MTIYNPFKPHIVALEIDGESCYAIRRLRFLTWEYLDIEDFSRVYPYYWSKYENVSRFCVTDWFDITHKYRQLTKRKNLDSEIGKEALRQAKFILQ